MQTSLRVSTTAIECFRLYSQPDQDWLPEADLIATIRGTYPPTPAILLGQAFGHVLEAPDAYRITGGYRCETYTFSDDTLAPAFALIDRRGVFEAKASKRYGPCEVVAKADHLRGADLSEFKTTTRPFTVQKYLASAQWRFYLDVFAARRVTYHVFCLDDHGNGVVELRETHSFALYPYADLQADCDELVARFCDYVTRRGLDGLLRQRQIDAEAVA
jgi:hypothetical protein